MPAHATPWLSAVNAACRLPPPVCHPASVSATVSVSVSATRLVVSGLPRGAHNTPGQALVPGLAFAMRHRLCHSSTSVSLQPILGVRVLHHDQDVVLVCDDATQRGSDTRCASVQAATSHQCAPISVVRSVAPCMHARHARHGAQPGKVAGSGQDALALRWHCPNPPNNATARPRPAWHENDENSRRSVWSILSSRAAVPRRYCLRACPRCVRACAGHGRGHGLGAHPARP